MEADFDKMIKDLASQSKKLFSEATSVMNMVTPKRTRKIVIKGKEAIATLTLNNSVLIEFTNKEDGEAHFESLKLKK